MTFLPDEFYARVEASVPIACVDFVPMRMSGSRREFGLILRDSPYGRVWCHLGGRVRHAETLAAALQRHAQETLGAALVLPNDPQPGYVYQWFPTALTPADGTPFGRDERKHSIGLAFLVEMIGDPSPREEALEFAWFAADELPTPLWPGCDHLFERLGITPAQ